MGKKKHIEFSSILNDKEENKSIALAVEKARAENVSYDLHSPLVQDLLSDI